MFWIVAVTCGFDMMRVVSGVVPGSCDLDAIVAASDQLARAALDILRDAGRRVPEDVAVVGHDNWSAIVTNTRPELTSVDCRLEHLGRWHAEVDR